MYIPASTCTVPSVYFVATSQKNSCLVFVFNVSAFYLPFAVFLASLSALDEESAARVVMLDSHIMNSPSYKLLLMVEPLLPVARVTWHFRMLEEEVFGFEQKELLYTLAVYKPICT